MKFKRGNDFYRKGTKQRFKIVDYDFAGNYYLCSFRDLKYAYLAYMQKGVTEEELIEKYVIIKEK